jgi:tRNA-Thr(GGU) m(6)t(6)A37 methyltransferase TsaA
MRSTSDVQLHPIGIVESSLVDASSAPKQGNEGAPEASLLIDQDFVAALDGLRPGDDVFVLTWLHRAGRHVLRVHPRDDPASPERGVFSTRSAERPNPVGLHRVQILAIDGRRVRVRNLEALNETPIVDIKPVIGADQTGA